MPKSKFRTFDALVQDRREQSLKKDPITIAGQKFDAVVLEDTSWAALEKLADVIVMLTFESAKVGSKSFRAEKRRLDSYIKSLTHMGVELFEYRVRMQEKAPDLIERDS